MQVEKFNEFKIEKVVVSKIETIISIFLKIILLGIGVAGVVLSFPYLFEKGIKYFLEFVEFPLMLIATLVIFIELIFDIIYLITDKYYKNKYLSTIKLALMVALIINFFQYAILMAPFVEVSVWFERIDTLFLAIVAPIILVTDYILSDYSYQSKRYYAYFALIPGTISMGLNFILTSGFNLFGDQVFINSIYDYNKNGWFTFDLSLSNAKEGVYGIGVGYLIIFGAILAILLALLLLFIKNKRQISKYNLQLEKNLYHQDL